VERAGIAGEIGSDNVRVPIAGVTTSSIFNSLTFIGLLAILGAVTYGGAAVFDESCWAVRRKLPYVRGRISCCAKRE
jgi:predicted methyltransferase MtxX (methanogen marker protein 4)